MFLQHPHVMKYLKLLKTAPKFYLTMNWFTKIESQLIANVLKCAFDVYALLDEPMFFYELSVKCIGIFGEELREDVNYILKNVVFNRKCYPSELLLQNFNIAETRDVVDNSLSFLEEIYQCYSTFMGIDKDKVIIIIFYSIRIHNLTFFLFQKCDNILIKSRSLDIRIGNIVPIDWMYSPIIVLYSQNEDEKKKIDERKKCTIITRCLQWIFLYETYFPALTSLVNVTDRFCRLCCVFLSSNSLFLEDDVQKLLKCTLSLLLTSDNYKRLDFSKEIQGNNQSETIVAFQGLFIFYHISSLKTFPINYKLYRFIGNLSDQL